MLRRRLIESAAMLVMASLGSVAHAQNTFADSYVDLTFKGTVEYVRGDNISLRNPGGSTTTIAAADIPDYRFLAGSEQTVTFRFDSAAPAFSNPACGGRVSLKNSFTAGGDCAVSAQVTSPFGTAGFGGLGGDDPGDIIGLDVIVDPQTGELRPDMPNGSYSFKNIGINPFFYDSASGTLSGPRSANCINVFNCPDGVGNGTATSISFELPAAGDYGKVQPGFNVGYYAGLVEILNLIGSFSVSPTNGNPVSVPEPDMPLLFGAGVLGLMIARRKRAALASA